MDILTDPSIPTINLAESLVYDEASKQLSPFARRRAIAKKARDAKVASSNDRIPNPYYNLNKQVGVIMVNALSLDEDLHFAEARTDSAICDGLVPVVFEDHIRLFSK